MIGKVKWFNNVEGYGFIGQSDGPDVFVHYSAIQGLGYQAISQGDSVEFQIVQGPEGPRAATVRKRTRTSIPGQGLHRWRRETCPILAR